MTTAAAATPTAAAPDVVCIGANVVDGLAALVELPEAPGAGVAPPHIFVSPHAALV